jgi:hypothetical protein
VDFIQTLGITVFIYRGYSGSHITRTTWLSMLENTVLRKIFALTRDKVIGQWSGLQYEYEKSNL